MTWRAMSGRPGVTELYLSSHKKKRMKQMKKMMSRGLVDPENEDPYSLFVSSTVRPSLPDVARHRHRHPFATLVS